MCNVSDIGAGENAVEFNRELLDKGYMLEMVLESVSEDCKDTFTLR